MARRASPPPLADPIVRHMRTDVAAVPTDLTVAEALGRLRADPPSGRIIYFYAIDGEGRLRGVIPTRRLLLSPPGRTIGEIMIPRVVALPEEATVLDACEFFAVHRFLALPVVDPDGKLRGVVDVELYADETAGLADPVSSPDELFQVIGVHLLQARRGSAFNAFRRRFPWLLCNVTGGLLAAWVTGLFAEVLQRALALALFVPIVLALSESVAIQSVSLAVQGLHDATLRRRMVLAALRREVLTGLLLGLACGLLVGAIVALWQGQALVALNVAATIGAAVTVSALVGMLLPVALHLLRFDPGVAAGPIALVLADLATLLVYFELGTRLL